jgi:hypothetical protein
MNSITLPLDQDSALELPEVPAIYAIFSEDLEKKGEYRCRFVGNADSLKQAVHQHFSIYEPHVYLRYFMLSYKRKLLRYMPLDMITPENAQNILSDWIRSLNPREHSSPGGYASAN